MKKISFCLIAAITALVGCGLLPTLGEEAETGIGRMLAIAAFMLSPIVLIVWGICRGIMAIKAKRAQKRARKAGTTVPPKKPVKSIVPITMAVCAGMAPTGLLLLYAWLW